MSNTKKPVALAVGAALIGGMAMSAPAFAMNDLAGGYLLGAVAAEGNCGADKGAEGACGVDKMDTDQDGMVSQAEFGAAHDGDTSRFAQYDTDSDGQISADEFKAGHEGKCGADKAAEGSCGADKGGEGKCGEGKCGGMA